MAIESYGEQKKKANPATQTNKEKLRGETGKPGIREIKGKELSLCPTENIQYKNSVSTSTVDLKRSD